jgi:hypothetical protein
MAATVSVRVNTSTNAATESGAVTGIDFISADNATNNLTNRQTYPITVGTVSYEKWLTLKIDAKPANNISNIQIWGDGGVTTSTSLYFTGNYATGVTPVNTTSSIADVSFTNYTAGSKATWDAGPYTNTNDVTNFAVFQLRVDSDAGPGNWEQETISYSYDET